MFDSDTLPALTRLPRPRNHREMVDRIVERRQAALTIAANTADMAEHILSLGDTAGADALMVEARAYLAEAARLAPKGRAA